MLVVAYIGFGVSVRNYHIPYVENRKNVKIKYIYRRTEDRIGDEECEKAYPEVIFTTDFAQILKDSEVNLVVVCAPDQFHADYAKQVLYAGKNVLVEKPFALTVDEAKEIFALAKEKRLVAMPNQNRRFDADFQTLKKVIQSGKLGELVEIESHYDYYKPGGWGKGYKVLFGLAVHPVDQMVSLLGIPERTVMDVRSIWYPGEADDYYDFDFFYGNIKAVVKTSLSVMIDSPRFTVHGKKGSFVVQPLPHQSAKKNDPNMRTKASMEALPEETWGSLCYINEKGEKCEERVPMEIQDYGKIYDNLNEAICAGGEKEVSDEEVIAVLEIIQEAEKQVKSQNHKD